MNVYTYSYIYEYIRQEGVIYMCMCKYIRVHIYTYRRQKGVHTCQMPWSDEKCQKYHFVDQMYIYI